MLAEAKESFPRKLAAALAVVLLFAATGASAGAQEDAAGNDGKLSDQIDRLIEDTTGDDAVIGPVSSLEEKAYADDALGQANLFATRVLNEHIAMRNEYMAKLQAIGWEKILDPDRLQADPGMVQSNRMVAEARVAAETMCSEMRPRSLATARAVAAQLKMSPQDRQDLLDGFILGTERNAATTETLCKLEVSILEEVAGIVSIFARDTEWEAQDGQYVFSDDRYVDEFNDRLKTVEMLTQTQTDLQRKTMSRASDNLRSLDF